MGDVHEEVFGNITADLSAPNLNWAAYGQMRGESAEARLLINMLMTKQDEEEVFVPVWR